MTAVLSRIVAFLAAASALSVIALFPPVSPVAEPAAQDFVEAVAPAPLALVCPGSAIALGGEDGTNVESLERLGTAELALHSGDAEASTRFSPELTSPETLQFESATSLELQGSQLPQGTELLAAAQYQVVSNARNRGLLAANCAQPKLQHTLVGGSLVEGHETLLLLANPSANESGVTVRLITDTGSSEQTYSVGAAAERIIALATLGAGESSIAVSVTSTQPIGAWLQHRASAGLEPLGISWVSSEQAPAESQNIFGLVVRGTANAPTADLVSPVVRVFNPGEVDADVLIEVSGLDSFGAVVRLNVPAGRVREVPVEGLEDGEYTARITAETPIHASLKSPIVVSSGAADFAWLSAANWIEPTLRFPAQSVKATLALFNSSSGEARLRVDRTRVAGATLTTTVTLAPFQQQLIEVEAGRSVVVTPLDQGTRAMAA
ncbi:MAG: hypothetical protein RL198_912, partial [Actinomycetota bacterium]